MSQSVLAQPAYAVANASGLIKLDAMENPFDFPASLPDELRAALAHRLAGEALNRYPDPQPRELESALRAVELIAPDARVMFGNGSDELIQILIQAVVPSGRPILAPQPTFVMYEVLARALGVAFEGVDLHADFTLDVESMRAAIARSQPALVFLAWPNNPTGRPWPREDVLAVLEALNALARPGLLVVDEAYGAFAEDSLLNEVPAIPGLVVLRTLSKLGLAGLRLGYLVGPEEWIAALDRLRLPYNINRLTQTTVTFALQHFDILTAQASTLKAERARVQASLATLPGVVGVVESACNFVLIRVRKGSADAVFVGLKARGVLIKNVSRAHPLLADHLRITVGTPAENDALLAALGQMLGAPN
ncbi:MAG: histidinol-phosphate transaminase [Thioalkalivibrionaceae bacterium]